MLHPHKEGYAKRNLAIINRMLHVELENILGEDDAVRKARELIDLVDTTKAIVVVTRQNRPAVALIDVEQLENLTGRTVTPVAPLTSAPTEVVRAPMSESVPVAAAPLVDPVMPNPAPEMAPALPELPDLPDMPAEQPVAAATPTLPAAPNPVAPLDGMPAAPVTPPPFPPMPAMPAAPSAPGDALPTMPSVEPLPPEDLSSSSPLA